MEEPIGILVRWSLRGGGRAVAVDDKDEEETKRRTRKEMRGRNEER